MGFDFFFKNKHNKRINGKIYSALKCSQVGTSSYTELQENYSGGWKKVSIFFFLESNGVSVRAN